MALYICPKCPWRERDHKYLRTEEGESTLKFSNGHVWTFPNLILHYIHDHNWRPPEGFVEDVLNTKLTSVLPSSQKIFHQRIGFLSEEDLIDEDIPEGLVEKLEDLISQARRHEKDLKYYGSGDK